MNFKTETSLQELYVQFYRVQCAASILLYGVF